MQRGRERERRIAKRKLKAEIKEQGNKKAEGKNIRD